LSLCERTKRIAGTICTDPAKISWTSSLKQRLAQNQKLSLFEGQFVRSLYRPFFSQWAYYHGTLNHRVGQMHNIYPKCENDNLVIMVKQRWSGNGQMALMVDRLPELQTDGGAQCFPLYLYEEEKPANNQIPCWPYLR
jgi:predicted helicase